MSALWTLGHCRTHPRALSRPGGRRAQRAARRVPLPHPEAGHGAPGPQERPAPPARRTLHTGAGLLADTQARRLEVLFAGEHHAPVQASWGVYQRLIRDLQGQRPGPGKVPDATGRPRQVGEITALARPLTERSADPLTYFDRPVPPMALRQAIDGRSEHLTRHCAGAPQSDPLHHPQPHPPRTLQRPSNSNHLNPTTGTTYHTLKYEEPQYMS